MSKRCAVVMGDIIGSESAPSVGHLHSAFNRAVANANARYPDLILSPLTITLGDEFQGLVDNLPDAFRLVSRLRLELLQTDVACRFVIGAVSIETPLNETIAWNMMGPGLSEARDRLNDKSDASAYRFCLPKALVLEDQRTREVISTLTALLDALGSSMTTLEKGWTATQLSTVAPVIVGDAYVKSIAQIRRISDSSVYKTMRAANYETYAQQRAGIIGGLELAQGLVLGQVERE